MHAKSKARDVHPLSAAREENELSKTQLAKTAGVDRRTVIRTEQGAEPLVTTAIKLARAVGRQVEDLWGRDR